MVGVILTVLIGTATGAWAELCVKCKDNMFTQEIGKCVECGGTTSSGAFKLCKTCSAKLDQCEHCRAALTPSASKTDPNLVARLKRIAPLGWEVVPTASTAVVTVTRKQFIAPTNISVTPVPSSPAGGEGSVLDAKTRGIRVWFFIESVGFCSETEYTRRQTNNSNIWEQLKPLGEKVEQIPPTRGIKPSFLSRTPRNAEEQSWLDEYNRVRKQLVILPTHHEGTNAFVVSLLKGHPGATINSAPILEEIESTRKTIETILIPFKPTR
jgi:hypothetical protein